MESRAREPVLGLGAGSRVAALEPGDRARGLAQVLEPALARGLELARARELVPARGLELARELARELVLARGLELVRGLVRGLVWGVLGSRGLDRDQGKDRDAPQARGGQFYPQHALCPLRLLKLHFGLRPIEALRKARLLPGQQ